MNRFAIVLMLVAIPMVTASSPQEPAPSMPKKTLAVNDKFSGTVTALDSDSVTVVRTVPARDAVTRKFLLDVNTRIEGKLRVKARVTIQYEAVEEGQFHALHIIVR